MQVMVKRALIKDVLQVVLVHDKTDGVMIVWMKA